MTTRTELEIMVTAYNHILKPRVEKMNNVLLLRNVHPNHRSQFAYRLYKEHNLSKSKALEFTDMTK